MTTLLHFAALDALGCVKIHIVQMNPAHQLLWVSLYVSLLNWKILWKLLEAEKKH